MFEAGVPAVSPTQRPLLTFSAGPAGVKLTLSRLYEKLATSPAAPRGAFLAAQHGRGAGGVHQVGDAGRAAQARPGVLHRVEDQAGAVAVDCMVQCNVHVDHKDAMPCGSTCVIAASPIESAFAQD